MEKKIDVFGKVLDWVTKYGLWSIFKTGIAFVFVIWVIILSFNPEIIYNRIKEYIDNAHKENIELRLENDYKVRNEIGRLQVHTNALRVIVMEMHNGNKSITGLPFLKCSATYESDSEECYPVSDEYQELFLSRFPIFAYLHKHKTYCGTVDGLKDIDMKIYYKLASNNVYWIHISALESPEGVFGFLVLTFDSEPCYNDFHTDIQSSAIKLSILLNS